MVLVLAVLQAISFLGAFAAGISTLGRWRFGRDLRTIGGIAIGCAILAAATSLALLAQRGYWPFLADIVLAVYVWRARFTLAATVAEEDKDRQRTPDADNSALPLASTVRVVGATGDGTGFLLSSDGHIATVAHGVPHRGSCEVVLFNEERYPATVLAVDDAVDLAILKVDVDFPLPAAKLDDGEDLHHGEKLFMVGYDPISDIADARLWTPRGYRDIRLPFPTVLTTALANAGYDRRSEDLPPLDGLLTDPNRAVRPGFSGAMVCDGEGRVVAIHNSGVEFGGYGGEIRAVVLREMLQRHGIGVRSDPLWRMPLGRDNLARNRGRATYGLASFIARFGDDFEFDADDVRQWREYFAWYGTGLEEIPEYQAVKSALDLRDGSETEAEASAWQALEVGTMRFARYVLVELARRKPDRSTAFADRFAELRSRLDGPARYGSVSYRRSMLALSESELRELAGDVARAEALLVETMPDHGPSRKAGVAWFRIGKLRLALDRPEAAVEAFRDGVGDKDLYEQDWSPLIEACARSSRPEDHAYGIRFALWALDHSETVRTMPRHAALCAERRGEPELANWFAALGRAVNPPEGEPEVDLPGGSPDDAPELAEHPTSLPESS